MEVIKTQPTVTLCDGTELIPVQELNFDSICSGKTRYLASAIAKGDHDSRYRIIWDFDLTGSEEEAINDLPWDDVAYITVEKVA